MMLFISEILINIYIWYFKYQNEDEQVIKAGLKTWVEEYEIDMAASKHASRTAETVTIH